MSSGMRPNLWSSMNGTQAPIWLVRSFPKASCCKVHRGKSAVWEIYLTAVSRAELARKGCAWVEMDAHFWVIFMETKESASGAQISMQGAWQKQTLLVLLLALVRERERASINKEISPANTCLVSPMSHSEGNRPIRVRTLLPTQSGEARSCGMILSQLTKAFRNILTNIQNTF